MTVEIRKRPQQARSKARVETILEKARELISEVGSDGLKMSQLAQRSNVPIGTVYQFFPNKSAVVHTLAKAVMDDFYRSLDEQFQDIKGLDDAAERIENAVRTYYQLFKQEPAVRDILLCIPGDKNLQILDKEDSIKNAELLFSRLKKFVSEEQQESMRALCLLNIHLTGSVTRMASSTDEQTAKLLLDHFITSAKRDLKAISRATNWQ